MAELGLPESTTASARRRIRFPTIDVVRLLFPPFPVDGDGDGDRVDGRRGRLVFFLCAMGKGFLCSPWGVFFRVGAFVTGGGFVVFLCAMGNDLLCSLVGSLFRVGVFGAGGGFLAGLLLLRGASASFIFGWPWGLLEVPKLLFISFRALDLGSGPHRKWRGVRLGSLKAVGVSFFVGICGDDGGGELLSPGMELDEMNSLI